jgi:hypothetical protein
MGQDQQQPEPEQPDITEALNQLDATVWRVLQQTTLRALVQGSGRTPVEVSAAEREKLLDPFTAALMRDAAMMREVLKQAYLLGVGSVHAQLHGQPGVDDEMLDEAIVFHSNPQDTDAEALKP